MTKKETSPTSSTPNYASEPEPCEICGGLGYVTRDVPVGHPDFGKAVLCICQHDKAAARKARKVRKVSNLEGYHHLTFDNFTVQPDGSPLHAAAESAFRFTEELNGWLVFQGDYGTGKTHLAAAIGNQLLALGHEDVVFLTVPDLLDHLRTTYHPASETTYDVLFDRLRNAHVLILDDLGTESPTAWAAEKLFQLLNHRYVYRLPTVITTNHRLDDMDGRIASRLSDTGLVQPFALDAPDFRRTRHMDEEADSHNITDLSLYHHMTFESFDWAALERPQRAKEILNVYISRPQMAGWLFVIGGHGTGKTHIAAAIAQYRMHHFQDRVMFLRCSDMFDYLRNSFNKAQNDLEERFRQISEADVLVLDDLTTRSASAWVAEKLFQIIDYRYLTQKPTVFTAVEKELETLDDRIESRLKDRYLCTFVSLGSQHYPSSPRQRQNIIGLPIDGER